MNYERGNLNYEPKKFIIEPPPKSRIGEIS
jgi:hypothetical protein